MSKDIELVAAIASHTVMQLMEQEFKENQLAIEDQQQPIYWNIEHDTQKMTQLTSSQVALLMSQIALDISEQFRTQTELTIKHHTAKKNSLIKEEDVGETQVFPWQKISELKNKKCNKRQLRKILMPFCLSHYKQVYMVREMFDIGISEWRQWIKGKEQEEKQTRLKKAVLMKGLITLQQFKKLAKREYRRKVFRASDPWCLNFISRNNLQHLVLLKPTEPCKL